MGSQHLDLCPTYTARWMPQTPSGNGRGRHRAVKLSACRLATELRHSCAEFLGCTSVEPPYQLLRRAHYGRRSPLPPFSEMWVRRSNTEVGAANQRYRLCSDHIRAVVHCYAPARSSWAEGTLAGDSTGASPLWVADRFWITGTPTNVAAGSGSSLMPVKSLL